MPTATHLRYAADWRGHRIARRYCLTTILTPNATAGGTFLLGLRKTAANPEVFISRIRCHVYYAATTTVATVIGWRRAASVAGGNPVTASDIPDMETGAVAATLEVLPAAPTAVTGTAANRYLLSHPALALAAAPALSGSGPPDDWTARDLSERIRLTAAEGLILDLVTAGDVDMRIHVMLVWEEIT